MKHDIAFLHTADMHVGRFSDLVLEVDPQLNALHVVDEALLAEACNNGITPNLQLRIEKAMSGAASTGAKVVVCTCSTIGGTAESSAVGQNFYAMRIDRAMANEAVQAGGRILIVAVLESTLIPTLELVQDSSRQLQKSPEINTLHVRDAWQYFESGDISNYLESIARGLDKNWQGHDVIILAQASMADASQLCENVEIPVLSSPMTGVRAAVLEFKRLSNI